MFRLDFWCFREVCVKFEVGDVRDDCCESLVFVFVWVLFYCDMWVRFVEIMGCSLGMML